LPHQSLTNMPRLRVLVVDDDPLFRSLLTSMLRKEFLVSAAIDGEEAYYQALEQRPDLAIIDIQMPRWDGLRTLKAFRAHPGLAVVPVMMLTSDASRQTVMAAIQAGANDYVIKTTLARDDLFRRVCRQLKIAPESLNPTLEIVLTAVDTEIAAPRQPVRAAAQSTDAETSEQVILDDWD
jgi:PleD family two-component response regulator